jgi:hypothetical protein
MIHIVLHTAPNLSSNFKFTPHPFEIVSFSARDLPRTAYRNSPASLAGLDRLFSNALQRLEVDRDFCLAVLEKRAPKLPSQGEGVNLPHPQKRDNLFGQEVYKGAA